MTDDPIKPQLKGKGGCLSKLVYLSLLVAALGLCLAIVGMVQPQDLSDLRAGMAVPLPQREMKEVLKSAIDRSYTLPLAEAELNQWLARTVVAKQGGMLGSVLPQERVWVRLEEGRAEVILERKFLGRPFTTSMYLKVERVEDAKGTLTEVQLQGGPYHPDFPKPPRGGRFGNVVVPQGFLLLVMPSFQKLAAIFPEEIKLGFSEMQRIQIEKGKLTLDPRETLGEQGMPPGF
jgi:hypothetical protein